MCFTPTISLSVAVIEFILATTLLFSFPKTTLRNFSAALIYLLGFYQFTEFMLCTSGNPIFWAKLGFIAYTFLPAIGLHTALRFVNRKPNYFIIYSIPLIFGALAFYFPVILSASCQTFFVEVRNIFNQAGDSLNAILFSIYEIYYFGFIFATCLLFYLDFRSNKNKRKKKIDIIEISGILLMTIPTIVLLVIFPYLGKRSASVLCGFALSVAITSFIVVYLESKIRKN